MLGICVFYVQSCFFPRIRSSVCSAVVHSGVVGFCATNPLWASSAAPALFLAAAVGATCPGQVPACVAVDSGPWRPSTGCHDDVGVQRFSLQCWSPSSAATSVVGLPCPAWVIDLDPFSSSCAPLVFRSSSGRASPVWLFEMFSQSI